MTEKRKNITVRVAVYLSLAWIAWGVRGIRVQNQPYTLNILCLESHLAFISLPFDIDAVDAHRLSTHDLEIGASKEFGSFPVARDASEQKIEQANKHKGLRRFAGSAHTGCVD